jgi:hypothetical protein
LGPNSRKAINRINAISGKAPLNKVNLSTHIIGEGVRVVKHD